jgi:5-methylcytosine-specific restriction endonuclease McrA
MSAKVQAYEVSGKKKETDARYRASVKGKATRKYNSKKRKAVKRDKGVFMLTQAQWDTMVASCNGVCPYCNTPTDSFTLDHLTPISKGGKHVPENIIPCCYSCNSSKHNRDVFEWLEYKGYAKVNYASDNIT